MKNTTKNALPKESVSCVSSLDELAGYANYSFMDSLNSDPEANDHGVDHDPRQIFSGHYVPVMPTPIENPEYVAHSKQLFHELGFADSLAESAGFMRMFSGDLSQVPEPMRKVGWATGYALSIFGTEYIQQCPFKTGNGYGDGRAISVLEAVIDDRRWEMQLKGGGRTPYCRGADGRAVLRSSVREFLAQEHMHALDVPTSRSLSLYVSKTEQVQRPWYSEGSRSFDPDRVVSESVAITTRVASSFIRVGQVELFGRRARPNSEYNAHRTTHHGAMQELEMIVMHLIDREYSEVIDQNLSLSDKVLTLAREFRHRLTSLVANWIRVGYCQGNFNSDNTAVGGLTLDYGPFGFIERFNPGYQPWTGGGEHFAFFNQPMAAERNFTSFCTALQPLLQSEPEAIKALEAIRTGFANVMQEQMQTMLASKLGLESFDRELFSELANLMMQTSVDYTIFFRELSSLPDDIEPLKTSFYKNADDTMDGAMQTSWTEWLDKWRALIKTSSRSEENISSQMKSVNPKYILREWLLAPAYQHAAGGDYGLLRELQDVMTQPYAEQSKAIEDKYYRLRPSEFSELGGVSHMSCSS